MSIVNFGECKLEEEKKIPLGIPQTPPPKKNKRSIRRTWMLTT
jgi:hypothetical protein